MKLMVYTPPTCEMLTIHEFFRLDLNQWAAVGTIVNGATVIVLVVINVFYLRAANRQAKAGIDQANESQRQANAAMESLKLLKEQREQEGAQEFVHVLGILHGVKVAIEFWQPIVKDKWGMWPQRRIIYLPDDWPIVVYRAGKISAELRGDVRELEQHIGNAALQMERFVSAQQGYRDERLMPLAWQELEDCKPALTRTINAFETAERTNRAR